MVAYCAEWLGWLEEACILDASNAGGVAKDREARRVISVSQFGSGAWLQVTIDANIRHSKMPSAEARPALQYRTGLASVLTALTRRSAPGQPARRQRRQHREHHHMPPQDLRKIPYRFNRCVYDALPVVSTGAVLLGDKDGGSPRARADTISAATPTTTPITARTSSSRTTRPPLRVARLHALPSQVCCWAWLGPLRGKPFYITGNTHAFGAARARTSASNIRRTALGRAEPGGWPVQPRSTGAIYVAPHKGDR